MPEENDLEKTEDATPKRIRDAVQKGQVAFSREVASLLMFVLLALNIFWLAPYYMKWATLDLSRFVHSVHDLHLDAGNLFQVTRETVLDVGLMLLVPILGSVIVALAASLVQNGVVISAEPIKPKLEKISILKGVKRLFSMRSMIEFIKGLAKISIVGLVAYLVVEPAIPRFELLPTMSVNDILEMLSTLAFRMVVSATMVMVVIAVLDVLYQRYEYLKSLRMTKQEVKDEFKQSEGDPQVKAKLRQIRMERAKNRMMSAVPEADVVIRNPTHYAIALKYDEADMQAPTVTALGQDFIALKIIEIAEENDVPVVENRPLARALYDTAELDQEIPFEHYQAVAEIISYVWKMKGRRM